MVHRYVRQWDHNDSPLLWIEMIYQGDTKYMSGYFGFSFDGHYFISQRQKAIFYKNLAVSEKAMMLGYKKYQDQKFIRFFSEESQKAENTLVKVSKNIIKNKLSLLSDKILAEIFVNFFESSSALYAFYRFTRPDFYESIIKNISDKYPGFDINNFLQGHGHRQINSGDRIILKGLKLVGERRYQMHVAWGDAYAKAEKLFQEIGRRTGLTSLEVQNCTSREIVRMLLNKRCLDKVIIKKRLKNFKFVYLRHGFKIICPFKYQEVKEDRPKIIKGVVAYKGKVKGRVVIIPESLSGSLDQIQKVTAGDVLVTVITSPDMVPAMKKAAAVVTDEGGILCHAAIVSRELKVPCIISTKIATRVLRTGDFIEVDANQGIIKIL